MIAILATLALLATLLVPMVTPAAAGAGSYSTVTKVGAFDPSSSGASNQKLATVQIKLDPAISGQKSTAKVEVLAGDGKQLKIKEVWFAGNYIQAGSLKVNNNASSPVDVASAKVFDLEFVPTGGDAATVNLTVYADAKNCAEGEVKLNFFSTGGQLDGGQVTVAKASKGKINIALVGSPPTIGESGDLVTIRLSQTAGGAFGQGDSSLKFKLPAGFNWDDPESSSNAVVAQVDTDNERILKINVADPSKVPGVVDITAEVFVADTDSAKMGDVTATVETDRNTSFAPSEFTVATYSDYGAGSVKLIV